MPDLTIEIEQLLRQHRLPALDSDLPDGEFILPHYDGFSIVNVPATTAALLDVPFDGAPPMPGDVWATFSGGVRCVIRVIIDALGYRRLQRLMKANADTSFHRLLQRGGRLVPLTSVCPSTTVTALSSLWSGRTPAEHGLLGTRLFLRDRGLQAHMIFFTPVGFERPSVLLDEGLEPVGFLPVPGFAEIMSHAGVESHVFINARFKRGGLSDIFFRGATAIHSVVPGSGADLWTTLREFLEQRYGQRLFVSVYWSVLDHLAHERGPSSRTIDAELLSWTALMTEEFLKPLSRRAAEGTVLAILSDHGQADTPPARAIKLNQHPALLEHLLMKPLGEPRFCYLYVRQGRVERARRYIQEQLGHAFVPLNAQQALDAGLFGGGPQAGETAARLGDLLLISRKNHRLYDQDDEPHLLGMHGGLSPEEMLVPCLMTRLDA